MRPTWLVITFLATMTMSMPGARAEAAGDAADAEATSALKFSVETDIVPVFLDGYTAVVGVTSKALPHWQFEASSFALDLPDFLLTGDNEGFAARVRPSVAVLANYYFSMSARGWFVGSELSYSRLRVRHDRAPDAHVDSDALALLLVGGYRWYPFAEFGLYVKPWVLIGKNVYQSADVQIDGRRFAEPPVVANALVHVGFTL